MDSQETNQSSVGGKATTEDSIAPKRPRDKLFYQELHLSSCLLNDKLKEFLVANEDVRPHLYDYNGMTHEETEKFSETFISNLSKQVRTIETIQDYIDVIQTNFSEVKTTLRLNAVFKENNTSEENLQKGGKQCRHICGLNFQYVNGEEVGKSLTNMLRSALGEATFTQSKSVKARPQNKVISINDCSLVFDSSWTYLQQTSMTAESLKFSLQAGDNASREVHDELAAFCSAIAVALMGTTFQEMTLASAAALIAHPPLVDLDSTSSVSTLHVNTRRLKQGENYTFLVQINCSCKNIGISCEEEAEVSIPQSMEKFKIGSSLVLGLLASKESKSALTCENGLCCLQWPSPTNNSTETVMSSSCYNQVEFSKATSRHDALRSADLPVITSVYGWGHGSNGFLGYGGSRNSPYPLPITIGLELGLLRVKRVSCSAQHAAAVTDLGLLYTWGLGTDGALGHSSYESQKTPTLVSYFGIEHPLVVTDVSCGSDNNSTHTVVKAEGYRSFGGQTEEVGKYLVQDREYMTEGANATIDLDVPDNLDVSGCADRGRLFVFGHPSLQCVDDVSIDNSSPQLVTKRRLNSSSEGGIKQISCGGGFTVVLTTAGNMYSWGKIANGRLGVGETNNLQNNSEFRALRVPQKIVVEEQGANEEGEVIRFSSISCGAAHTIAVSSSGELFSWGRNTEGQLGDGTTLDRDVPTRLYEKASVDFPRFITAATGTNHSLAISDQGTLYSWGGMGGAMIGLGDYVVKDGKTLSPSTFQKKLTDHTSSSEMKRKAFWRLCPWLRPREIMSFRRSRQERILQVDGGDLHTVAVTISGEIYMWGTIAHFPKNGIGGEATYHMPRRMGWTESVELGSQQKHQDTFKLYAASIAVAGGRSFALSVGSTLSSDIRRLMPREVHQGLDYLSPTRRHIVTGKYETSTISSNSKLDLTGRNKPLEALGDAFIAVDGHRIPVHTTLLAMRSPVFAEKLKRFSVREMELVLPDLTYEVAICLLEFIYSDNLSLPLGALYPHLPQLHEAAKAYEVPKLQAMCHLILYSPLYLMLEKKTKEEYDGYLSQLNSSLELDQLHSDFAKLVSFSMEEDLAKGRENGILSDLVLSISDKSQILIHQSILSSRSDFFDALLNDSNYDGSHNRSAEVSMPDQKIVILLLVDFVYTNELKLSWLAHMSKTEQDDALYALFQASDRYGIHQLKSLCESIIIPTPKRSCAILELGDRTGANLLKQKALWTLLDNFEDVYHTKDFQAMQYNNPGVVYEILRKFQARNRSILTKLAFSTNDEEKDPEDSEKGQKFPFKEVIVAACLIPPYLLLAQQTVSLGYVVPLVNMATLCGFLWYLFSMIKGD